MSDISNLDILEKKIGQALERLQKMGSENRELKSRLKATEQERDGLQRRLAEMETLAGDAKSNGSDLAALKGRVDGILSKFEQLDL